MASKTLTAGTFILISLILSGAYMITEADKNQSYYCSSNQLVGICDKLTTNNTRCYYTLNNKTAYKGCSTGWAKMIFNDTVANTTVTNSTVTNLCYTKGDYTYCCGSRQLDSGSCDWITRR